MSITPKDLVLYGGKDGIYSGGYKVDGFLKDQGIDPLTTFNRKNNENLKGGKIKGLFDEGDNNTLSGMFVGLGIPAGLSNLMSDTMRKEYTDDEDELLKNCQRAEGGLISNSLYDKLLALSEPSNNNDYEDDDLEPVGGSSTKKRNTRITRRKNMKHAKQSNSSGKKMRKTRKGH